MNKMFLIQPYHMVTVSPWPILMSFIIMMNLISIVYWFHMYSYIFLLLMFFIILLGVYQWWRDVIRESLCQGFHNLSVVNNMKFGMILFIISELMFFVSFFWCYLHLFLSPNIELGNIWPPLMIYTFNPYFIPLLNTMILLSSGVTITLSHFYLITDKKFLNYFYMLMTLILGVIFTLFQLIEYKESLFTISDSAYGSIFFMGTGFHGLHVLIGSMFLLINFIRIYNSDYSKFHHFGFEAASWYWHFVDVIWLFLYLLIYYWSS